MNNFAKSEIYSFLNDEYYVKLAALIGINNICEHTVDLTADDGLKDYKKCKARVSLLTCELYRKYTDIMLKYNPKQWWWLATAYSTLTRGYSEFVRYVNNNGTLNNNYCNNNSGVRPFWKQGERVSESRNQSALCKRVCNLSFDFMTEFEEIVNFGNLYRAWKKSKRGKRKSFRLCKIESMTLESLYILQKQLIDGSYTISPYNEFEIFEPKKRLIKSAHPKDKIVQMSLCENVLIPKMEKHFIDRCFAGRKGKGTLYGLNTLLQDEKDFFEKYGSNGYFLKCDITKFFYTIDHCVLKDKLRLYFSDKKVLSLCDMFIDSVDGDGLALGNQTSQLFANLLLNELDHFIVDKLKIKYYGRYMDDFYLIHADKNYLKYCLTEIAKLLLNLKLSLNGKTQITHFNDGIKFLGFHTYPNNGEPIRVLCGENRRRANKKYNRLKAKLGETEIYQKSYSSWKAFAKNEIIKEDKKMEEVFTLEEASKKLGYAHRTLYSLLKKKQIRGVKLGRTWRIKESELKYILDHGLRSENAEEND